jgi:ComF family protein
MLARIIQALSRCLPQACLACGEASVDGPLCAECRAALPWNDSACARCALPLPQPAALCGRCLRRPPPQGATLAPLRYAEPVDQLLTALKFGHSLAAGRALSQLLRDCADLPPLLAGVTLATAVPLHRQRLRERGYNQALELLRPLLVGRGITLALDALQRARVTAAQTGLDAAQRRRNLRRAFTADPATVAGHRVLLMDDVITTGATAAEAARTLLAAGAIEVRVLAVARVARG